MNKLTRNQITVDDVVADLKKTQIRRSLHPVSNDRLTEYPNADRLKDLLISGNTSRADRS